MKKILLFGLCCLSLLFFSCSTTEEVVNNAVEDLTDISEKSITEELSESNVDSNEKLESESANTETNNDILKEDNKIAENNQELPLPAEIEEPEITTIEPEDIPEPFIAICPSKPEPIIMEPVIDEDINPIIEEEDIKKAETIETIDNVKVAENIKSETNVKIAENKETFSENTEIENNNIDSESLIKSETSITSDSDNNDNSVTTIEDDDIIVINPNEEENKEDIEIEEEIIPSRSVTIKRKEYLDISYPGSGWIYMGATDGSRNLTYFGRALGTKDTTFTLQGRKSGTKILHFYKNDHLTNEYLDDYVEVIILDSEGSTKTHIAAPKYKQPVPKKSKEMFYVQEAATETEDLSLGKVDEQPSNKSEEYNEKSDDAQINNEEKNIEKIKITDEKTLLQEAQLLYNEEEYKLALEKVNNFLQIATKNIDEGLFLKGKILESKSDSQNIKEAIESYKIITKEYPASKYWNDANKRIVYLKRFYLEVR